MTMNIPGKKVDLETIGEDIFRLIEEMYPICRSITGDGVRKTLAILQRHIPMVVHEIPTGTQVFDWVVPKEWNIRDAYIKNPQKKKIVDFHRSNLHVLNYSVPVKKVLPLAELKHHLFSIPEYPDQIPYRTSYYKESWGFCLSHNDLQTLEDGDYEILIDSSLNEGHLTYAEHYIEGKREDEVLVSCHICHPSLANDNLAGIALSTLLAKHINQTQPEYSYRFLFIPGTIGAITWLALNPDVIRLIKHGLVISGGGDGGAFTYKKSRKGDAEIDRSMTHVLEHYGKKFNIEEFSPYGYDERQYCSPGFNLPVGRLSRTPYGEYPEYHTSADNLDFVKVDNLAETFSVLSSLHHTLENNRTYQNTNPRCEPQLGRRGLYDVIGGHSDSKEAHLAILWVLNLSDGDNSILNIAQRSGISFQNIKEAADSLERVDLLEIVGEG